MESLDTEPNKCPDARLPSSRSDSDKTCLFCLTSRETHHSRQNRAATRFSSFESLFPGSESLFHNRYAVADEVPHFCGRRRRFVRCEGRAPPSRIFGDRKALTPLFIVPRTLLTAFAAATQFSNFESLFKILNRFSRTLNHFSATVMPLRAT